MNDLSRVVRVPSHLTKTAEYSVKSTSAPVGEDDNKETYADRYLAAEAEVTNRDKADFKFEFNLLLDQLKPKQRTAVCMFYGIGYEYEMCMDQIAIELSVTGERARQLVRQAEIALSKLDGIQSMQNYL